MSRIDPEDYAPLAPEFEQGLIASIRAAPFPAFLGLEKEAVRRDYARMRLRYRPELNQPAGIVHGGAIASLIDTAVVGAVLSAYTPETMPKTIVTIDMHVHYLNAAREVDLICHAAVRRRGRQIVFLEAEVIDDDGRDIAHGELSYMIVAAT
ncbi:MAG: PaaI family thioesterase [Candidatus Dadabacteria bacterium]|nr:MAG: PaaI family thioesterase [Candidatus Dadabacteria bacterium]